MTNRGSIRKYERVISLLLYLSSRDTPATKSEIEANVEDYEGLSANEEKTDKMFRRDLEALEDMGVHLDHAVGADTYLIDVEGTFSHDVVLDPEDVMTLRLASIAPLRDPSFVYGEELRSAVVKLAGIISTGDEGGFGRIPGSDEDDEVDRTEQDLVRRLEDARLRRRTVTFSYTKPDGEVSERRVDPYGLFSIKDDWYLIGFDHAHEATRSFRVDRICDLKLAGRKEHPDFQPVGFDVSDYIEFPFAFGKDEPFEALFLIPRYLPDNPTFPQRKAALYEVADLTDHLLMVAGSRSVTEAARWAIEHDPAVLPVAPPTLVDAFERLLEGEEVRHG